MAKKQDYLVLRAHEGDKHYGEGDIRHADPSMVGHLVPNTLKPVEDFGEDELKEAQLRKLFRDPAEGRRVIEGFDAHSATQRDEIDRLTRDLATAREDATKAGTALTDETSAHGKTRAELDKLKADPRLANKAEPPVANKSEQAPAAKGGQ